MKSVESVLQKVRANHDDWLVSFTTHHPTVAEVMKRPPTRQRLFLNLLIVRLFLLLCWFSQQVHLRRKPARYIFQGLRNRSLIEILPSQEVLVVGGRKELFYCLKRGYQFHWIGYIAKAFERYRWSADNKLLYSVIMYIQDYFKINVGESRYLFLWEDSQPAGVTLSTALESIPGLSIVCIAHGMFFRYKGADSLPPEGKNCKFNLVWSNSQKELVKGGRDPATFVLGLPYEISLSYPAAPSVVVVGHCGRDFNREEFFYSYYLFSKIFSVLDKSEYAVSYRPHPTENIFFARSNFRSICVEEKMNLLSSSKKIFIGIASSLLYEAREFGHIVIALEIPNLPYYVDFEVDGIVRENEYVNLPSYLGGLIKGKVRRYEVDIDSLAARMASCINEIDSYNARETSVSAVDTVGSA